MELRRFSLERYKGYARRVDLELAPLTILVGPNNAGKTALAQAIQLLAGGLAPAERDAREPLPLESGGIRHGGTFEDLVTGCAVHGRLKLSITLADGGVESSLSATVTNVSAPGRAPERQISDWRLTSGDRELTAARQGFGEASDYLISMPPAEPELRTVAWRGLFPARPGEPAVGDSNTAPAGGRLFPARAGEPADWVASQAGVFARWAAGVRHLRCPRRLLRSPFRTPEHAPVTIGSDGHDTPLALAADDALRKSVREWYRRTFGVRIDFAAQGKYREPVTGTPLGNDGVRLDQSGRGLSHVLPVVVTALSARRAGPGADVIEHPEAELHPAAHAEVAELLLANLAGPARPLIVETHSEMVLLRARRWVAEGRLPAGHVLVYWIHAEPGHGSVLEKIGIRDNGDMETWPDGVFIEDYEEIMAIRRAARGKG